MSKKTEDPGDQSVGYGRPPKASQYKKGQSGNPHGRPRKTPGRQGAATRVFGEIQRLSGQPKGARVRYTTLEVIVMTLKQLAAAGHSSASILYLRFAERFGMQRNSHRKGGYLVVPEELTEEEWVAQYSPKDPPSDPEPIN